MDARESSPTIFKKPSPVVTWIPLALLIAANLCMLASAGSAVRIVASGVILLLPGFAWCRHLLPHAPRERAILVAPGLSYLFLSVIGLLLHYLPGPIPAWSEVLVLDVFTFVPLAMSLRRFRLATPAGDVAPTAYDSPIDRRSLIVLGGILVVAAALRFGGLGFSEFQGDEALAMISAAQALDGHQDALFLRGKGPGEVLLPMMVWGLTGTINETVARLPFALAGLLSVVTIFALARRFFPGRVAGHWIGLAAAGLFCLNGFAVAFSRIVQYQSLVMWMSALAVLCAWEWSFGKGTRWLVMSGWFLAAGFLAHYDAILVVPAILFLAWNRWRQNRSFAGLGGLGVIAACAGFFAVSGLFYLPYLLDPQASRTGGYLGHRIGGGLLKNNLADFQSFNIFYTSSYYYILTGALVLALVAWLSRGLLREAGHGLMKAVIPLVVVSAGLAMALWPHLVALPGIDLAIVPFALMLLGAFLSKHADEGIRTALVWLAIPFLGYNFGVAVALTHIYTIIPAWVLLAAFSACSLFNWLPTVIPWGRRPWTVCAALLTLSLGLLFTGYLWLAYLRHSPEFRQDWPESRSTLYWTPFAALPKTGFFGFPHRTGWKGAGSLYATGALRGDFVSNEEPDITAWYLRGAPRACDGTAEYFYAAGSVVDAWPVDEGRMAKEYGPLGEIVAPGGKSLKLNQRMPTTADLGQLTEKDLVPAFDSSAFPAAFAISGVGSHRLDANLGDMVEIAGFDVDTSRAWPGGRVTVTLFWRPLVDMEEDMHVFVHLESVGTTDQPSATHAQADGRPVCWSYPTFDWRPGQTVADHHGIELPNDVQPGRYVLRVGMYSPETGQRLDVLDENGTPIANFVELATVAVVGAQHDEE